MPILLLASIAEQAGLSLTQSHKPEAKIYLYVSQMLDNSFKDVCHSSREIYHPTFFRCAMIIGLLILILPFAPMVHVSVANHCCASVLNCEAFVTSKYCNFFYFGFILKFSFNIRFPIQIINTCKILMEYKRPYNNLAISKSLQISFFICKLSNDG